VAAAVAGDSPQFPSPVVRHANPVYRSATDSPADGGELVAGTPDVLDTTHDNPVYDSDGSSLTGGEAFAQAESLDQISASLAQVGR
jgi:hypothetical protein